MKPIYFCIIILFILVGIFYKVGNDEEFSLRSLNEIPPLNVKYLPESLPSPDVPFLPYHYPNLSLPAQVIGCGGRRGGCTGGSEITMPNIMPQVNISPDNIAPMNLMMRGFDGGLQQIGTIQKVFGNNNLSNHVGGGDNDVYPLFGRKKYRNDNKWEYFVKYGTYGVILPIITHRNYEELNTNDEVKIQGQHGRFRVTIYDEDIPQFLPFS